MKLIYEADVNTHTCLYLMQNYTYTWNIFLNYGKMQFSKKVFVDVSTIITCD